MRDHIQASEDVLLSQSKNIILFGATGDLSRRMLLPSLFALHADGLAPDDLVILGTARSDLDDDAFRNMAKEAVENFLPKERQRPEKMDSFLKRISYQPLDASTLEGFDVLARRVEHPEKGISIFLSTAPFLFEPTIKGLHHAGLSGDNVRIGLEKPLGTDLQTSREINDAVAMAFPEERTFRIDHYLGKETVQNLMALRFANRMFEPLWNAQYIDHIQITISETVGLEGRHSFYNDAGALRDMVQNHMLQLLALTAMEPPADYDPASIRDEKVKVLRALRSVSEKDRCAANMAVAQSWARPWPDMPRNLAKKPILRPLWRLKPISTIGAGKVCHFICAPAKEWPKDAVKSPYSSSLCRIIFSPAEMRMFPPTG